jgi:predicted DNA-binding transcriptional regulator AlpA
MNRPEYATNADLASLAGVSSVTLWRKLKSDPIPSAVWLSGSRLYRWQDAEAWAAKHRRTA